MRFLLNRVLVAVAILMVAGSVAMAQTAPKYQTVPMAPGALGTQGAPGQMTASPPEEKLMDGPVKKVDPLAKTVSVGWMFGMLSTTLEVTDATRITVEGATGSFQDIREGAVVKASYEEQDGKNIAKSIEVTGPDASTAGAPRSSGAPSAPMGSPYGAGTQSSGEPKTP